MSPQMTGHRGSGGAESDWVRTPLSQEGFPAPMTPASERFQSLAAAGAYSGQARIDNGGLADRALAAK